LTHFPLNHLNHHPTGGNNLEIKCGPKVQNELETRDDVLVFTTARLEKAIALTGEITTSLSVSSLTNDTDWTVKLTDVRRGIEHPTGIIFDPCCRRVFP
jgi:predicted acyl esterase